jgi:hypothetical protein
MSIADLSLNRHTRDAFQLGGEHLEVWKEAPEGS